MSAVQACSSSTKKLSPRHSLESTGVEKYPALSLHGTFRVQSSAWALHQYDAVCTHMIIQVYFHFQHTSSMNSLNFASQEYEWYIWFNFSSFNDSVSTAGVMRNTGIIINRDFGRLQEEIILCFKFPFQHLPGGPEKKN